MPFQSDCAGLLLPGDRKRVEPIAARVQPQRVQAAHQSLHHFVARSDWSDDTVLVAVRARVMPVIEQRGPIRALIIDDTGMNSKLASRFAAIRVRPAHRDYHRATPRAEEWRLIEWPAGEPEPTKYFLSTLPASISRRAPVHATKLRWRIERDDQDLKQELGLGHYQGRGWRGFHHHATLCIAAYGFLRSERGALSPSAPRNTVPIEESPLPRDDRPRGSPDQT